MPERRNIRIELAIGALACDDVAVSLVSGVEALSEPYAFDVEFRPRSGSAPDVADLVGAEARLSLQRPDEEPRHVHGLCFAAEAIGTGADLACRVRIGPKLLLLARTSGSRVYQPHSGPGGRGESGLRIAMGMLRERHVEFRDETRARPPDRDMIVQYRESDLGFLSRLLAEEGVCYWFEHAEDRHVMVLGDAPDAFQELSPTPALPFRAAAGMAEAEEHVFALRRCRAVVPDVSTLDDFDFERPAADLTARAGQGDGAEVYDPAGGYTDAGRGRRLSGMRLEEHRLKGESFRGEGTCVRLSPGLSFEVQEHPSLSGRLLATRVAHDATQQTSPDRPIEEKYLNRFEAIAAGAPFRPPPVPRSVIGGVQTATVVGAPGEEIHTDRHGRIKVKFHWDRTDLDDDRASAWVRLAQPWAGPGFGALFVPRLGQEVIVRFVEGDPDRPLVTGAVYNGANPPPFPLPKEKTASTLRSSSTPGGAGANELAFEDARDAERIAIHAQRDERVEVLNDKVQQVKEGESLEVEKDRARTVHGNHHLEVMGADDARVGGRQTLKVAGPRGVSVRGSHKEKIGSAQAITVGAARNVVVKSTVGEGVGAAAALTVGGAYAVSTGAAINYVVGGLKSAQIAGAHVEIVGKERDEAVGGDASFKVGGDFAADVGGQVSWSVEKDEAIEVAGKASTEVKEDSALTAKKILLEADKLELSVGGNIALQIDSSGNVKLYGKKVLVDGSSKIELKGSKIAKDAPGSASQGNVQPPSLQPLPGETAFVEIELKDEAGKPLPFQLFQVEFPDGKVKTGYLDKEGRARVPGAKEGTCKVSFPGLDGDSWRPA